MGEALQGLRRVCSQVRFLGSYPRAASPGGFGPEEVASPPVGASDADFAASARWLAQIRSGALA
jgi:prephenate dehydratase